MIALFDSPLFVGAHVDDVELFAGGTLARFSEGARVTAFSSHKGIRPSPEQEFVESMRALGVSQDNCFAGNFPACQPGKESFAANRHLLYSTLAETECVSVVITHQSTDYNQDHRQVYEEVVRVFGRRCSILGGCFPSNDIPAADRRFFVVLQEEHVAAKIEAVGCYDSQRAYRPYFEPKVLRTQMEYWGSLIGCEYAECFEVIRLWV